MKNSLPTPKPTIRPAEERDARALWEIYGPFIRETAVTFDIEVPPIEEFARRIRTHTAEHPWVVACVGDQVVGYANATEHRKKQAYCTTKEVSIYLRDGVRGMGIGKTLYESLLVELKKQGVRNLLAGITVPNEASVKFHESLGFELVGTYRNVGYKMGAWRDVSWYEMWLGD
jgi:L-amino acid N-acyltransferase YncA